MIVNNIDTDKKVFVIAEIGNNHEGNFNLAKEMISLAAEAGADAVKFQTFKTNHYVSKDDRKRFDLLKSFEQTLKRYQISIKQVVSFDYIKEFIDKDDTDIHNLSKIIVKGSFENEVLIVNKSNKNQGFFEKFFNFFS